MKNVTITEKFKLDGVSYTQTRHGEVLKEENNQVLVRLANFGTIIEKWFPKEKVEAS